MPSTKQKKARKHQSAQVQSAFAPDSYVLKISAPAMTPKQYVLTLSNITKDSFTTALDTVVKDLQRLNIAKGVQFRIHNTTKGTESKFAPFYPDAVRMRIPLLNAMNECSTSEGEIVSNITCKLLVNYYNELTGLHKLGTPELNVTTAMLNKAIATKRKAKTAAGKIAEFKVNATPLGLISQSLNEQLNDLKAAPQLENAAALRLISNNTVKA